MDAPDPRLVATFGQVLEKISEHPTYADALSRAAGTGRRLVLNYHTHGPGQGYCVSVCARNEQLAGLRDVLEPGDDLQELAHIRGIGREEAECRPLMGVFGALLRERYGLDHTPQIWLDGHLLED